MKGRPGWLNDLSTNFKRHRQGRPGWFVELKGDRLRVASTELPPRPDEQLGEHTPRRCVFLSTPPGPATVADALKETCALYDAVKAGAWRWPDPDAIAAADDPLRLTPAELEKLVAKLQASVIGETITADTWSRSYQRFFTRLLELAGEKQWLSDLELLQTLLRSWPPNSRSRQQAHDRLRALWTIAGWPWPEPLRSMRGNGRAAAHPDGVRCFTDDEITELRGRIKRSRLSPAALVAWDCLIAFGLRPAELQGLELGVEDGVPVADVRRVKRTSKGSSGPRQVAAVLPDGWPVDCFELVKRWRDYGVPENLLTARSPGQLMTQQLRRLREQEPIAMELDVELTAYSVRHAFALRLAQRMKLHPREAALLMGHSPQVHLEVYGRRLDSPRLISNVIALLKRL